MQEAKHKSTDNMVHGYQVEKTAKRMKKAFAKILAKADSDITVDQWVIVEQLYVEDKVSQLELAKATEKDPPTVTRIIDLLAKKSLVDRVLNEKDRRKFNIILTEKGRAKVEEVNKLAVSFRSLLYKGLKMEDVLQLEYILDIINSNLNKK